MKKFSIFIVLLAMLQTSCTESEWINDGDYFFFESKGAVMPVWVKGNISSGVFILTNHGGPGYTTGHDFTISVGFKELEEDYALIYWDQRMSGLSQGDPNFDDMSIDQHIEDLSILVEIIEEKYNPASFYMMGHSWGGTLSGGYLGRDNNQSKFNGWIDLDGSIQDEFEGQAKKEWILARVDSAMAVSDDPEYWQFIIDWYEENPNPVESDPFPYWYVGALRGYAWDWDLTQQLSPIPYSELIFRSPFTFAFYWTQYEKLDWMDGYDVTQEVSNISIPVLLLWGKEDGAVPATVAQFTYDLLATDPADKEIVLIEECAHSPHFDTPDLFAEHVTAFVEKYR